MMEKENLVETILVRYSCDKDSCDGLVEYDDNGGGLLMSNPPKYKHTCGECGKKYVFLHKYPYTKYKIID